MDEFFSRSIANILCDDTLADALVFSTSGSYFIASDYQQLGKSKDRSAPISSNFTVKHVFGGHQTFCNDGDSCAMTDEPLGPYVQLSFAQIPNRHLD